MAEGGLITDPTAGKDYHRASREKPTEAEQVEWADWVNDRRHIDSPTRDLAESPIEFRSHSPALPDTPNSTLFWEDDGETDEERQSSDSESEAEGGAEDAADFPREKYTLKSADAPAVARARAPAAKPATTVVVPPGSSGSRPATMEAPPSAPSRGMLATARSPRSPTVHEDRVLEDDDDEPKKSDGKVQILILEDAPDPAPAPARAPEPEPEPEPKPQPRPPKEPKPEAEPQPRTSRARERKENEEPAEPDNRTEEEKLFDKQVTNLCKRYPVASEDEVKKALTETKGHAGRASKILMKQVMDQRAKAEDMLQQEKRAMAALTEQRTAKPAGAAHAADRSLPSAIELTGSHQQPDINGVYVKVRRQHLPILAPAMLSLQRVGVMLCAARTAVGRPKAPTKTPHGPHGGTGARRHNARQAIYCLPSLDDSLPASSWGDRTTSPLGPR